MEIGQSKEQMLDEQVIIRSKNTMVEIKAKNYNANKNNSNSSVSKVAEDKLKLAHDKFSKAIDKILKKDIGSFITDLFNKYQEFLLTLTPDKILAIYNIKWNAF